VQTYAEIEQFERELFAALPARSIGDLRVLWHRCADSDYLEGEAFVSLKARVPSRSIYDLKQLPSATLACAYSGWDDRSSERAYGALRKWTSMRVYRLAGPKREIYLDQLLEVQVPLKLN
jgi:effector-binding domain-containing protein